MRELFRLSILLLAILIVLGGVTSFIEWRRRVAIAAHPRPRVTTPRMMYCTYSGSVDSTRGRFYNSTTTYEKVSGL